MIIEKKQQFPSLTPEEPLDCSASAGGSSAWQGLSGWTGPRGHAALPFSWPLGRPASYTAATHSWHPFREIEEGDSEGKEDERERGEREIEKDKKKGGRERRL